MPMNRRKVLIYLRPETHAGERVADSYLDACPRGDRSEQARTALLAGIALGQIDARLPPLLAALLADDTGAETLLRMLTSFLNVPAAIPAPGVPLEQPSPVSKSATNLAGMLPG
ncbi:plasmid stabilization protein [Enterobacter asburiae]|uniref:Plasmid stabilization protein n=1 Tax=Lelliottia amnigena TaxID=61646 RepID=A0AAP2F2K4_LELAM|nr:MULTISPECIES: plasmid partitioning/stability family protein [Enterobacteriaceae]MBL5899768.1 plasmid stabilization protein [Lelliottia amnigena]MBL5935282.1 plasmid stabilization protein [Lelliottia amnigena]MBL5945844.1 plasmid stabilization protein [Enterobacter asburiae]MBL5954366.1 plasmid stabilization protein [Enterobacter asburiae]